MYKNGLPRDILCDSPMVYKRKGHEIYEKICIGNRSEYSGNEGTAV